MAAPGLFITQINLHHSKGASAVLQRGMTARHTGISLIQEPWLVRDTIWGLGGRGFCYRDPKAAKPRVCILAKGVNVVPLLKLSSRDMMVISTDFRGIGKLVMGLAYFPYDSETNSPDEVRTLVEYCKVRGLPLLLGCDTNSHHTLWGSMDTNSRERDLLEYLIPTDLDILNTRNTLTFHNSVREEVIDITLCTKSFRNRISK